MATPTPTPTWLTAAADRLGARGVLVGPSGHGKTGVLDLVADAHGGPVARVRGRRFERDEELAALDEVIDGASTEAAARRALLAGLSEDGLLVVDDAHWLDDASLRVLVGVADRLEAGGTGVVAAHRPSSDTALGDLDRVLGPPTRLDALDEAAAGEHLAALLGTAVDAALVDAVLVRTEGVPALVDALADGWAQDGRLARGRLTGEPDPPPAVTVEAIRIRVQHLGAAASALLGALAVGAVLDDELLAEVADVDADGLAGARDELRAAGLLVAGHDDVVTLVAAVVGELAPPADLRARQGRVVAALRARGVPAATVAEHVVAADLGGADAATTLIEAGTAILLEDPGRADDWLARAAAAGAERQDLAGPAAVAAFLTGRPDDALVAADDLPPGAAPPDRARAGRVRAAVLAGRGLWAQAAADLGAVEHDAELAALAVTAAVGAGDRSAAARRLDDLPASPAASLAVDCALTTARSLLTAVGSGTDLALTGFAAAAELAERRLLGPVPITPHALGVVVATAAGELTAARDLADRALRQGVGGPAHERHHLLLRGWVALREGRWDQVEEVVARPGPDDEPTPLAVRHAALEAGLARRAGDLPRLMATWEAAEPLLLRQPVSPFAVEPTAELVIGAHRLGAGDRVAPIVAELEAVSADLPLWALVLDWLLLQAAAAADDGEAVADRARAVAARPAPGPRLDALAPAAAAWLAVLAGEVHEDQVGDAADGLVEAGLVWEASRLVGQAAIRTDEPALARALLERARDVKGLLPAERDAVGESDDAPAAPSVLSEREQEVGALVLDGLTHKEIGAQLYISPKTVEHHVAKIRQKLGVSTRAELLAALRS